MIKTFALMNIQIMCTFYTSFQLKVTNYQGTNGDDTGLESIGLNCGTTELGSATYAKTITSKQGAWGTQRERQQCHGGYFTGGQFRSVPPLGSSEDDTGATDMKMLCSGDGQWYRGGGNGKEVTWGDWLIAAQCPSKHAVCGIQTLVVDPLGSQEDDTSLSGARLACCSL